MGDDRSISRYISIIQRLSNPHFDKELSVYQIGCGQQFFLLRISDMPGISLQQLAALGHYDKATATRAVRKLEREGYVKVEMDEADKRVRRLYLTEKAKPVIHDTLKMLDGWIEIITKGLTQEERLQAGELLEKMADNARLHMNSVRIGE